MFHNHVAAIPLYTTKLSSVSFRRIHSPSLSLSASPSLSLHRYVPVSLFVLYTLSPILGRELQSQVL